MRIRSLVALPALLVAPVLAFAQPNGGPPTGGMPRIEQVQLTDETAKAAIDSYLEIKEKYGDEALPKTKAGAAAKGAELKAGVAEIIEKAGFATIPDWNKTVTSVGLAYGVVKEGGAGKVDESIAKIDANSQLPEQVRAQLKAMLLSTKPSDNNVEVIQTLMKDPDYGPKLKQLRK